MHVIDWTILAVVVAGIAIAVLGWDRYRGSRTTAGRDDGGHRLERNAVGEHARSLVAGLAAVSLLYAFHTYGGL